MAKKRRRQRAPAIRLVDPRRDTLADQVNYIVGRALDHEGRMVTFGPLALFSTPSGDAWLLDPADHLALPLAENGSPLPATIREPPDNFSDILRSGLQFFHQYDFGSTTELSLMVVGERTLPRARKPVQLLARNEPPAIRCGACGSLATQVCSECLYDGTGWLCERCAKDHECGDEMLLPVVNSPS